jgi:hypothetical protein
MAKFLVTLLLLAACGAPAARSISADEASRLARMRSITSSRIHARVPTGAGVVVLDGLVDFAGRSGSAAMTTEGRHDPASAGALRWDPSQVGFREGVGSWQTRALRQDGSELDSTLLLLVSLHATQPDNPTDLERSIHWLRSEDLGGTQVDVFEGDRLTYWVDVQGRLRRLQARLGGNPQPAVVDLT